MVYPMGGTIDGVQGDHVLLAPPFIVEASQVDAIVERLGAALEGALARCAIAAQRSRARHEKSAVLAERRPLPSGHSGIRASAADLARQPTVERT